MIKIERTKRNKAREQNNGRHFPPVPVMCFTYQVSHVAKTDKESTMDGAKELDPLWIVLEVLDRNGNTDEQDERYTLHKGDRAE